jgi:hypothetical protein
LNFNTKRFLLRELPVPVFVAIFSAVYFFSTKKHDFSVTGYPYVVIGVIQILLILILRNVFRNAESSDCKNEKDLRIPNVLALILSALCYLILIPRLGYYASTLLLLVILMVFFKVRSSLFLFAVPIGYVALSYIVFRIFLRVPLPEGILF